MPARKRQRWFMQYLGECPVCGADKSYKEARYDEPPPKEKRYRYLSQEITFDGCIY